MAMQDGIALNDLLGKTMVLTVRQAGFDFERKGRVIGVLRALPGSRCNDEFLLDQDNGDSEFYSLDEVVITHIE